MCSLIEPLTTANEKSIYIYMCVCVCVCVCVTTIDGYSYEGKQVKRKEAENGCMRQPVLCHSEVSSEYGLVLTVD